MNTREDGKQSETDTEAAIDAGIGLAELEGRLGKVLDLPVALIPNGMSLKLLKQEIDLADERADAPRRLKGTSTFSELDSFIAHVNRHKGDNSVVFADTASVKLTTVYNYNEKDKPRWRDHRAHYACPLSDQWKLWNAKNGCKFKQDDFAQFIEDHMDDLASPTGNGEDKDLPAPSEVLTMARDLVVKSKGEFSRKLDPVTGNSTLYCKNEGETGSTRIPRAFLLKLPVFEAGQMWRVEARVRFEFNSGVPIFSYLLYRAEEIKREAFSEVRTIVIQRTELPLFAGAPEA